MPTLGKYLSNNLQTLITNSSFGVRLALAFGRYIPPSLGYPLAQRAADYISRQQNWGIVRGARLNQWVVNGQRYSRQELDQAVQVSMRCQARYLYELYQYLARPAKMKDRIVFSPEMQELMERSHSSIPGQGLVLVGIHLSNFDFALHSMVQQGLRGLVITLAELSGGYKKQFDLRQRTGMELAPASVSSFRMAIERLKAGGMVVTGIDRPVDNPKNWPAFFGHPAPLPVHHVYMALKAEVPVVVLAARSDPDGKYRFLVSKPIHMKPDPDRNLEIIHNAESVLSVVEQFISQTPQQWAMFLPVWPLLRETVPG